MIPGYDHYVLGLGNSNHPANQPEIIEEPIQCDSCGTYLPEKCMNTDTWKGKDTGWRWCDQCLAEMEAEDKLIQGKEKAAV
jgi:Pyruvate/2-oxoacid:ferredoxin oxidoreductase delta subunit